MMNKFTSTAIVLATGWSCVNALAQQKMEGMKGTTKTRPANAPMAMSHVATGVVNPGVARYGVMRQVLWSRRQGAT